MPQSEAARPAVYPEGAPRPAPTDCQVPTLDDPVLCDETPMLGVFVKTQGPYRKVGSKSW